jgi:Carboxypeptidase regulatory-like domain/TonB dependent receptor
MELTMKKIVIMSFFIAACYGFIPIVAAQQKPGLVQGTVEDPTGAKVSQADVKLVSKTAGQTLRAVTDEAGHFAFTGVAPGEYFLRVKMEGFEKTELSLSVGDNGIPVQRIALTVAQVTEEITVSGRAPSEPLESDQNATSTVLEHDMMKDLPTKNDDPLAVATLFVNPAANDSQGTKIIVDGIEGDSMEVPRGSVKSVAVDRSPYSVEFGRPGKGRIEVTTRGGSIRRFHKRVEYAYRDAALDARNHFEQVSAPRNRKWFEGQVDGPLFNGRATFFAGADFLRDSDKTFVAAILPKGPLSATVPVPRSAVHVTGRTDIRLTPLNLLSVRYTWAWDHRQNQGVGGFDLPDRAWNSEKTTHELRVSEIATPTANFMNQFALDFRFRPKLSRSLSNDPTILVAGAFNSGSGLVSQNETEKDIEFQESATYIRGKHTFLFGGVLKSRLIDYTDSSNFSGTFNFSNLTSYVKGQPFLYTVNSGDPRVSFTQREIAYFLQDQIRLLPRLSLTVGLRHELQSNLSHYNNLAPRVALAASTADGRFVMRAGGGIFYERQPVIMEEQFQLLNGTHLQRTVVTQPGFPSPGNIRNSIPDSITRIHPNIRSPYIIEASLGVERRLGAQTYITAEYNMLRGRELYRMRDINAPSLTTGLRPDPNFVNVDQFETAGSSESHAVTVGARTTLRWLQLLAQYTWAHSIDNTSGINFLPADNFDPGNERGRSNFDQRHRFNLAGVVKLPYHFNLGVISSFRSGAPYNITSGFDTNGDTVSNDRPSLGNPNAPFASFGIDGRFVGGTSGVLYNGQQASFGRTLVPVTANSVHWLVLPGVGNVGRNVGAGPIWADVDIRLTKKFILRKAKSKSETTRELEFRFDAFNVLNKTNYVTYVGDLTSQLFGQPNRAYPSRELQMSARVSF